MELEHTLHPEATWDDKGLWFTLIVYSIVFAVLTALSFVALLVRVTWLRRLYRTNHTAIALVHGDASLLNAGPIARGDVTMTKASPLSEQPGVKVGCCLPFRCSLLTFPSWRSWLSVEEGAEHLESLLDSEGDLLHDKGKTSSPLSLDGRTGLAGGNSGDSVRNSDCAASGGDEGRNTSTVKKCRRQGNEETGHISFVGGRRGKECTERVCNNNCGTGEDCPLNTCKTPLDPQVALYVYFLKIFATIFVVGFCLNAWICALSATDNYLETTAMERDEEKCHEMDGNVMKCMSKRPYCRYMDDERCYPEPLDGLYDLSVQNISPRSWRLWCVALLDVVFSLFFVFTVLLYLWRVDTYVEAVMKRQLKNALGHRVAVVYGLRNEELSELVFREKFLTESAYFGPGKPYKNLIHCIPNRLVTSCSSVDVEEGGDSGGDGGGRKKRRGGAAARNEEVYHQCEVKGTICPFSMCACIPVETPRENAVFLEEGSVKQLLFPRDPPRGMYKWIQRTEVAMQGFHEAVADSRAFHRLSENLSDAGRRKLAKKLLFMRPPFPFCCGSVRKEDYWSEELVNSAAHLNRCISTIPCNVGSGGAFVIFGDALDAYEFVNLVKLQQSSISSIWSDVAGPPEEVIQGSLSRDRRVGWFKKAIVLGLFIVMLFFWSIPVSFLSSIDNFQHVPGMEWIATSFRRLPQWLHAVVVTLLPVIVLGLFNLLLPKIMSLFALSMGVINKAERDIGVMWLMYLFMVLTGVVFQAALQGGLQELASILSNPSGESIAEFFVALVTPTGGFWYARVIIAALFSTWVTFLDPVAFFMALVRGNFVNVQRVYDKLFAPCLFEWPELYSFDLSILAMGLLFHMTVPLLSFFVGIYFVVRYFTQRAMLYDRYRPDLHPRYHCTAFEAPAMAIRSSCFLYCLGCLGDVLFMSMRQHIGGVVICSFTTVFSIALFAYVYMVTRRWTNSLSNVRRLLTKDLPSSNQSMCDISVGEKRGPSTEEQWEGGREVPERNHPEEASQCHLTTPTIKHCSLDAVSALVGHTLVLRKQDGVLEEAAVANSTTPLLYENTRRRQVGLLPESTCIFSQYQPRHQRLELFNPTTEMERIERDVADVDRYWNVPFAVFLP
ncbi:putative Calcium dependent channel 7TM region putative phosphate [Trypanosoma vivax]|uniref:CSC1/OSCA1-like 7TM region domain-containing protein n=1 Tax=Trypanosoma vivax (strain Y486) TaxID=1055687 RepID=G0U1B8_TRYVY|nr:putative Calcium dependent channel 7TM region putative phosphate [Trypanosoma vivax]CCC49873.1 conserved hypothetical protein [Trypanosoma vivax Y486]